MLGCEKRARGNFRAWHANKNKNSTSRELPTYLPPSTLGLRSGIFCNNDLAQHIVRMVTLSRMEIAAMAGAKEANSCKSVKYCS